MLASKPHLKATPEVTGVDATKEMSESCSQPIVGLISHWQTNHHTCTSLKPHEFIILLSGGQKSSMDQQRCILVQALRRSLFFSFQTSLHTLACGSFLHLQRQWHIPWSMHVQSPSYRTLVVVLHPDNRGSSLHIKSLNSVTSAELFCYGSNIFTSSGDEVVDILQELSVWDNHSIYNNCQNVNHLQRTKRRKLLALDTLIQP